MELADAVVMMGDVLLIYQIKQRTEYDSGDEDAERRWFRSKVLRKATKQVRDTLRYLEEFDEILVSNERGRVFNLAARKFTEVIKSWFMGRLEPLPSDCGSIRHHVSETAGLVHIVEAKDYLEISRALRVPEEVVRYFRYRETVVTGFSGCSKLPEAAIAGHFIGGDPKVSPTAESSGHLFRLVQDDEEWDLTPLLRGLRDNLSVPGISDDYYEILIQFSRLPRCMWRKIKERIRLCVETIRKGEFSMPYRVADPRTDCGFVFVPADSNISARPDWPEIRLHLLESFTLAHKYDQRLSKCIGVMIAKHGEYFDIQWCLCSHPWVEDQEFQRRLDENFPFRPVKQGLVHGYKFVEE